MRVAQLAEMAEVHHRAYGVEGAVAMARSRRGGQFDPKVVDSVHPARRCHFGRPGPRRCVGARHCARRPIATTGLTTKALDALLVAFGDFVDLKCPFTFGHSREVAGLAGDAALRPVSMPARQP